MTNLELLFFAEERGLHVHIVAFRDTHDGDFIGFVDAEDRIVVYAGKASKEAHVGITYTPRSQGGTCPD